jgi:hypothetical protein
MFVLNVPYYIIVEFFYYDVSIEHNFIIHDKKTNANAKYRLFDIHLRQRIYNYSYTVYYDIVIFVLWVAY